MGWARAQESSKQAREQMPKTLPGKTGANHSHVTHTTAIIALYGLVLGLLYVRGYSIVMFSFSASATVVPQSWHCQGSQATWCCLYSTVPFSKHWANLHSCVRSINGISLILQATTTLVKNRGTCSYSYIRMYMYTEACHSQYYSNVWKFAIR